jgi:hypothetical protein
MDRGQQAGGGDQQGAAMGHGGGVAEIAHLLNGCN